jgi:hypothetical protein
MQIYISLPAALSFASGLGVAVAVVGRGRTTTLARAAGLTSGLSLFGGTASARAAEP